MTSVLGGGHAHPSPGALFSRRGVGLRDVLLCDQDFFITIRREYLILSPCVLGSTRTGLRNSALVENNRSVFSMATILIIDDEEIIRILLRSALEAEGYEVTEAANGREGLELYRQRPTDLVITDIVMPELNGLDMLLELTREFLHAKVIAISGAGEEKNVLDVAKLLGARQTFQKPFSIPHLLGAVRYELEH
jgi:two-component system response regulator (stage 0 sporulation protein F)